MGLIPYRKNEWLSDPFRELENLQKEMNRLFGVSAAGNPWEDTAVFRGQCSPAIDVYDSQDNFQVKADLPGMKKEEIEISLQDNNLTIKGEKKKDNEVKEKDYYKTERFYGSFSRILRFPAAIDAEKIDARYENGVLTVTLPKKEEAKPKQIRVNVK